MSARPLAAGLALAASLAASPALAADIPADRSTRATLQVSTNDRAGEWERSGDRDWYRVRLVRGQGYLVRAQLPNVPPEVPWEARTTLRDGSGRALASTTERTGSLDYPIIEFTAPRTGTYFIDVGATATAPTRGGLGYGVLVSPDCAPSARTACAVKLDGPTPNRSLQTQNDVDWIRASLRAGRSYTIELSGGRLPFTLSLVDARGRRVAAGQSAGEGSAFVRGFVPRATGDYYAVIGTTDQEGLIFAGYSVALTSP